MKQVRASPGEGSHGVWMCGVCVCVCVVSACNVCVACGM